MVVVEVVVEKVSALILLLHSALTAGKVKVSVGTCKGWVKPELCQENAGKLPLPGDGPDTARKESDSTISTVVALASMAP